MDPVDRGFSWVCLCVRVLCLVRLAGGPCLYKTVINKLAALQFNFKRARVNVTDTVHHGGTLFRLAVFDSLTRERVREQTESDSSVVLGCVDFWFGNYSSNLKQINKQVHLQWW